MIKGIAIFFLTIYLLGTTPIGEIFKLPILIEHYQKHHKENKDLSFIDFLKLHYFNGDPKDADYDEDMKLPFKSINYNANCSTYIACEIPIFKIERLKFKKNKSQKFPKRDFWHTNSYLDSIWQPPRLL